MTNTFLQNWVDIVRQKNSVLCAGVDPGEFDPDLGNACLPPVVFGKKKLEWALTYINAIAPYCAAIKPNPNYWAEEGDGEALEEIGREAKSLGLLMIEDAKLRDIGSTNLAGIRAISKRAGAVTFSPFAGNIAEMSTQSKKEGISVISMVLMSNPEFRHVKDNLVLVDPEDYHEHDIISVNDESYVPYYIYLTREAATHHIEGIVVGCPSPLNHITPENIERVKAYWKKDMFVLAPGTGVQGGDAAELFKAFGPGHVVVNVGRALMFPHGQLSTPTEQAEACRKMRDALNAVRAHAEWGKIGF